MVEILVQAVASEVYGCNCDQHDCGDCASYDSGSGTCFTD